MKPQDILILLKVLLLEGHSWRQGDLADSLSMSVSEVNHGLKRLETAGLYNPVRKRILRHAAFEFFVYGLRCVFPGKLGPVKSGTPTAHAVLADEIRFDSSDLYVWPSSNGDVRGQSLEPLYKSAPEAAQKDPVLHKLLALIDVLRVGQAREKNVARKKLSEMLTPNA